MSRVSDELMRVARDFAAQFDQRKARLEQEELDLETALAKKRQEREAASLAPQRLADYPVTVGPDYLCPRCWIADGRSVPLSGAPSPDPNQDVFRCGTCRTEFSVRFDH